MANQISGSRVSGNVTLDQLIQSYNIDCIASSRTIKVSSNTNQLQECMMKLEKWIKAKHSARKIESQPDMAIAELQLKVDTHVESCLGPGKALISSEKELYLFYGAAALMCGFGFATILAAINPL